MDMCLPHAPLWPDEHDDDDHRTMPRLLPVQIAADPAFGGRESQRRRLVTDLVTAYGPTRAAQLWRQALIERRIGLGPVR